MKKIITLAGVSVANDALPRVSATSEERLLASMPGLFFWLQAGPAFQVDEATFLERANGRQLSGLTPYSQFLWTQGQFDCGAPALVTPPDYPSNYAIASNVHFALDRWSVAMALEAAPVGTVGHITHWPDASTPTGEMRLRIGLDASGYLNVYRATGTSGYRIRATGNQWVGSPAVIVVGFSVERGLTIRVDVKKVSRAPDDKGPLDNCTLQLGSLGTTDITTFKGKVGHFMGFNEDLTSPGNRGYMAALESILMDRYGIS